MNAGSEEPSWPRAGDSRSWGASRQKGAQEAGGLVRAEGTAGLGRSQSSAGGGEVGRPAKEQGLSPRRVWLSAPSIRFRGAGLQVRRPVSRGKPWGCRGKGLSVTLTPTVTGVRSPQPLGPLEMSTEMVPVLPEVRGGWGSTRAESAGTRCLEGVGSGHRVGLVGGNSPRLTGNSRDQGRQVQHRPEPVLGAGVREEGRTACETPTGRGDVGQERPLQLQPGGGGLEGTGRPAWRAEGAASAKASLLGRNSAYPEGED